MIYDVSDTFKEILIEVISGINFFKNFKYAKLARVQNTTIRIRIKNYIEL